MGTQVDQDLVEFLECGLEDLGKPDGVLDVAAEAVRAVAHEEDAVHGQERAAQLQKVLADGLQAGGARQHAGDVDGGPEGGIHQFGGVLLAVQGDVPLDHLLNFLVALGDGVEAVPEFLVHLDEEFVERRDQAGDGPLAGVGELDGLGQAEARRAAVGPAAGGISFEVMADRSSS